MKKFNRNRDNYQLIIAVNFQGQNKYQLLFFLVLFFVLLLNLNFFYMSDMSVDSKPKRIKIFYIVKSVIDELKKFYN